MEPVSLTLFIQVVRIDRELPLVNLTHRFFLKRYETPVQPVIKSVTILLSSCGTFDGFTASLSLGNGSLTAWRIAQKFGALRPRGSGEPAGEYLPPSTHRLFYLPSPESELFGRLPHLPLVR